MPEIILYGICEVCTKSTNTGGSTNGKKECLVSLSSWVNLNVSCTKCTEVLFSNGFNFLSTHIPLITQTYGHKQQSKDPYPWVSRPLVFAILCTFEISQAT